ncbi:MAG: hypothetical protein QM714_11195 [Nocardioides sp.]|uniref:hypothetical protein n=1 Tax=Nocardioides sp. TaxID=35761 RepID=UPI0039E55C4D
MHTPRWTDEHSRTITAAAPPVLTASETELDRTWARVREDLPTAEVPRRRRPRVAIGAAVVAAILGVGGVATAAVLSAHTGRYPADAEDLELGGPGEYLDATAPDFPSVIDEVTDDIPFPSKATRAIALRALVADERRDAENEHSGDATTGAMRYWVARDAVCSWANSWSAAMASGDATGQTRAAEMLEGATAWPAVTDVDPEQRIEYRRKRILDPRTGQRVTRTVWVENTPAGYFPLVRKAAQDNDRDAMAAVLGVWGPCTAAQMPDFPQALDTDRAVAYLQALPLPRD